MKKLEILKELEKEHARSAWKRGVIEYAKDLLEDQDPDVEITRKLLLNGAKDWNEYSYCGCSFIYDGDICERLANNTEKKLTRNGERYPNSRETWLDVQARALKQASWIIMGIINK